VSLLKSRVLENILREGEERERDKDNIVSLLRNCHVGGEEIVSEGQIFDSTAVYLPLSYSMKI